MVSSLDFRALSSIGDALVMGAWEKLSLPEFGILARVCKAWKEITLSRIDQKLLEEVSFGKDQWLGVPGVASLSEEILLTKTQKKKIIAKLKGKCELFNESDPIQPHRFQNEKIKSTWHTQKLIFFPKAINGKPRTINSQNELFRSIIEGGHGIVFDFPFGTNQEAFCNQPALESFWGLVLMDVAPRTRKTTQEKKVCILGAKRYKLLTPNDAVTSNLIMNLVPWKEKKGYFFGKTAPFSTLTATTEVSNDFCVFVGATDSMGLRMRDGEDNFPGVGATGIMVV